MHNAQSCCLPSDKISSWILNYIGNVLMLWLLLSISSVNFFINCLVNNCGILWYKIVSLLTQIFLCLGYSWANGFWNFRFIYRGSSGNGTFAIQIAKHQGLKVLCQQVQPPLRIQLHWFSMKSCYAKWHILYFLIIKEWGKASCLWGS
jgi:hypothetical protein